MARSGLITAALLVFALLIVAGLGWLAILVSSSSACRQQQAKRIRGVRIQMQLHQEAFRAAKAMVETAVRHRR